MEGIDAANSGNPKKLLRLALVLVSSSLLVGAVLLFLDGDTGTNLPYIFLLPWILGLAVVITIPLLILRSRGELSFANPIVFACATYFIPAFVVGGVILSIGWSQPFYLDFIQDPERDLPYTVLVIAAGFTGLCIGYFLPWPKKAGSFVSRRLPSFDLPLNSYIVPALALTATGLISLFAALATGIGGFQFAESWNVYDGIVIATTHFWMQGIFLVWFVVFKRGRIDTLSCSLVLLIIIIYVIEALFAGSRAIFLHLFIVVLLAYVMVRPKIRIRHAFSFGIGLVLCLFVGIIYGTTFRNVKGGEGTMTFSQYTGNIFETFDNLGRNDGMDLIQFASGTLAERMETLSSLAVVVSNYQKLEPYEEAYGLRNNIVNDLTTFFIPRIIWSEKSVSSNARLYSELYFDYGQSSFAITPMGDLLRNFGFFGVIVGMCVLGTILRFLYSVLIAPDVVSPWKSAIYSLLLTTLSYESFYGSIISNLVKNGFVAVVGMCFVLIFARWITSSRRAGMIERFPQVSTRI